MARIGVVIPALDEEASIGAVLDDLPRAIPGRPAGGGAGVVAVLVADNGSTDRTAEVARAHGARVVEAPRRGYGSACLAGLAALPPVDLVVFLDGDHSDHPEELPRVVAPLLDGRAELVIGSRALGVRERGSMLPQQRFGNLLATWLIARVFGHRYTDLGPFRAVTTPALARLGMADPAFGWTVEMQVRALQEGLTVEEVPVSYRRRVGVSKIAGTVLGTLGAARGILGTILRLRRRRGPAAPGARVVSPRDDGAGLSAR